MQIAATAISGLLKIAPPCFADERGSFVESFNVDDWEFADDVGARVAFVEDDYSVNRAGVVRGLHGDSRTWKLVSCPRGSCFVVVVDCRPGPNLHRWESFYLHGTEPMQLLIPNGCATGFASLEDGTIFSYKQSQRYQGAEGQFTLRWDDPALAIPWPVTAPLLSARDAEAPLLGS